MKSEVRLDSAVFQLTPTRTRCDLVIHANGKSEKIASGLLNPFLAHLKVAQDQIAKGGYSITLEPDPSIAASWFTKGTVERFVRFVSTPEILERVTTIESEIIQIEEAIAVQSSETTGLSNGDDHQHRSADLTEGANADGDKAIVIYKPGSQTQSTASNGNTNQEENSKVQLLKVLEARRNVLRKEQGMAFARAVAAGFDMDTLPYLVSFSECFGASRLMKASSQFMELWKRKHETGQWVEVEAIDTMSMRSELPPFNMPAILLTGDHAKDVSDQNNPDGSTKTEKNSHEHFQGQFYPPWAMPYPPPYPMQGMPYYQNYPPGGGHSYYPSPYPPSEEYHHHSRPKRHSKSSSKDSDSKSHDGSDHASESDQDALGSSQGHKNKKGSKKKKKSNMVVIKNLNYITKKLAGSDSESGSGSGSESDKSDRSDSDKDSTDSDAKDSRKKHKKSSKKKGKHGRKPEDSPRDANHRDVTGFGEPQMEGDSGHWQAFQSFLLKSEEKSRTDDGDMFSNEREPVLSRRKEKGGNAAEPFLPSERDYDEFGHQRSSAGFDSVNGTGSRVRQISSNDEMFMSGEKGLTESRFKEIEAGGARIYRRPGTSDDYFIVHGQEKQMGGMGHDIDPFAESQYKQSNLDNNKSYGVNDESFMLAMRSGPNDNLGPDSRGAIDMDSELPKEAHDSASKVVSQVYYEPEELTMMPDRGFEPVSAGYDPAIDYESQVHIEKVVKVQEVEETSPNVQAEGKSAEKEKKVRKSQDGVLDKRRKDALIRRLSGGSTSRTNPLTEAQKRAQNLRSYKADLQKLKKEQEEEQIKRLEALKLERQKRIAARSNSANPTQAKPKPVSKPTPKTSKFTDADSNSTPVRKVASKTTPTKSTGSGNGLTRSVSSLSDVRKEKNGSGDAKRLSEPTRSSTVVKNRNVTGTTKTSSGSKETQSKKISAIMQLDQTKSATLPELKLKNNKDNQSHTLEFLQQKVESEMVVEKNVVSVENEVVAAPSPVLVRESEITAPVDLEVEKNEMYEREERMDKEAKEEQYVAVRAPPSPVLVSEVINDDMDARRGSSEVVKREEPSVNIPNTEIHTPVERPYQAPMARLSSLEEVRPVSTKLEPETPAQIENVQIPVSVGSVDPVYMNQTLNHETIVEKTKEKGSKGGFRKLLKFGRKSHPGEGGYADSDASSVDDVPNSSHDAHLLKNLITQDDTKVSKPFSLLSPFRRDKKVIVL